MNIIPYHRLTLQSPLTPAEAMRALFSQTTISESSFSQDCSREFKGNLGDNRFHISRCIGYRNSFLPVIIGTVSVAQTGSRIVVHMRPMLFVIAFLVAFYTPIIGSVITGSPGMFLTIPIGLIGYFILMVPFWFEALKAERLLRDIFRAT